MTPLPAGIVRPATAGDLPAVAGLAARLNAQPESQSLHCAAHTPAETRAALRRADDFPGGWQRFFALAADADGDALAAVGCQVSPDGAVGWLWGPWMGDERQWGTPLPGRLLGCLRDGLPRSLRRWEAFLHVENADGRRFLRGAGFVEGPVTHVYVARAPETGGDLETGALPLLGSAHEVAFERLHAETFPVHGTTPAADLLAGRDEEHCIFAVADGLRLLGYVCVAVNHAPREGFIEYLAVRPSARGRGVGARLLAGAQRWACVERGLPQVALCVSDWRSGARRLYEQAGFRLAASGVALRGRV